MQEITIKVVLEPSPALAQLFSAGTIAASPTTPAQPPVQPQPQPVYTPAPAATPVRQPPQPVYQQPAQAPIAPAQQTPSTFAPPPAAQVPTTAPSYTLEQLQTAAATLLDAGKNPGEALAKFGIDRITLLPVEQYGALATALRAMGAKI